MTAQNRIKTVLALAAVAMAILTTSAQAATMSASVTPPVVDAEDIANYTHTENLDKWFCISGEAASKVFGQTFTTGGTGVNLNAITYQISDTQQAPPTKTYTIRVGTFSGTTFTEIYSETCTQAGFTVNNSEFMTWTLDTPVLLAANTEYAMDVGMNSSTSSWTEGISYIKYSNADQYAGGTRYISGTGTPPGVGDTTMQSTTGERVFHIDLEHPMAPSPQDGETVPAGDVDLSWANLPANVGSDVWVDVWFGTDPVTDFVKVVDAGLNTTSVTVNAPVGDTYYWRVDSYLEGSPTGDPVESSVFTFYVDDADGDGLPDDYELLYTDPPSRTALNPGDDLEPDGLTNIEEFQIGTYPNDPDTDDDTLEDGDEVAGAGLRPPTDPLDADTDDDGLDDAAETNTGTWVSATDTGTDPTVADSDSDGLEDGVETNTGIFVDATNTGTDPTLPDSDGDDAGDWYEVAASYTDPTEASDNPGIPYPLPDPDSTAPDSTKPVKVYILSGQSNMVGMGNISGSNPGTLETITKGENKFPNLVDDANEWTVRNDVWYKGVVTATADKWLTVGCGTDGSAIGPELGFGHVMGYYHDEPVLVIKTSQGNRSIGWDFLPPGSEQYIYGDYTYAGYGDSPNRWLTGTTPEPIDWYAGKQYDDCVAAVHDVLDNFAANFPEWADQGYEIAGFGWWQGHKDQYDTSYADRYELNLANLINALRTEFNAPNAPFVVATIGFDGGPYDPNSAYGKIHTAQMAISNPAAHPEFAGNVVSTDSLGYWRSDVESPVNQDYHYNRNSETFMLVGDAMGRSMIGLFAQKNIRVIDFNSDGNVNFKDFSCFVDYLGVNEPSVDIAPMPSGDGMFDVRDMATFIEYWLADVLVLAHWRLDEAEGDIAYDDAGDIDGVVHGDPNWLTTGGSVGGALEFDGIDDHVSTDYILDPAEGPFSVYAWVKGGGPEQVVISQTNGTGTGWSWLCADSAGNLMTDLRSPSGRIFLPALVSDFAITDGAWRRIGLVWDGTYRYLYVDGAEVKKDSEPQPPLSSATGGLYFGAANTLTPETHWLGLIDDIRIYDAVVILP